MNENPTTFQQELRRRVGGRWAVSRISYILIAPTSIFSVLLVEPERSQSDVSGWLLTSALSYLVLVLLLYCVHKTLLKDRHITPVSEWFIVILGFALGALKGVSVELIAVGIDLQELNTNAMVSAGIGSGLTFAIGMPALAFIASVFSELREQHQTYTTKLTSLTTQRLQNLQEMSDLKIELGSKISQRIQSPDLNLQSQPTEVGQRLRQMVNEVRPISHELWLDSKQATARYNSWELFKGFSRNPVIELWPILLLFMITSPAAIARYTTEEGVLARVSVTLIGFALALFLADAAFQRITQKSKNSALVGIVIFISAVTVLFPAIIFGSNFDRGTITAFALTSFWVGVLIYSVGFILNAQTIGARILNQLESDVNQQDITASALSNLRAKLNRDAATYLHGQYQSQLLAIAVAIEEAETNGDSDGLRILLHQAIELVNDPLRSLEKTTTSNDVDTAMAEVFENWDGILEIQWQHTCGLDQRRTTHREDLAAMLSVLLDEAIRNAFRHGLATAVQVQVNCRDENVTDVSVADNGNGIAITKVQDTRRGIGSALFDTHCGANWQLAANPTGIGSLLTFEI
jgi:hypothetical protein